MANRFLLLFSLLAIVLWASIGKKVTALSTSHAQVCICAGDTGQAVPHRDAAQHSGSQQAVGAVW